MICGVFWASLTNNTKGGSPTPQWSFNTITLWPLGVSFSTQVEYLLNYVSFYLNQSHLGCKVHGNNNTPGFLSEGCVSNFKNTQRLALCHQIAEPFSRQRAGKGNNLRHFPITNCGYKTNCCEELWKSVAICFEQEWGNTRSLNLKEIQKLNTKNVPSI